MKRSEVNDEIKKLAGEIVQICDGYRANDHFWLGITNRTKEINKIVNLLED